MTIELTVIETQVSVSVPAPNQPVIEVQSVPVQITVSGATPGLSDALSNGTSYGRKDGTWVAVVNKAGDTVAGPLFIDGSSDQIQLRVQGHSTQTTNLQTWETSAGAVKAFVNNSGGLLALGHSAIGTDSQIDYDPWGTPGGVTLSIVEEVTSGDASVFHEWHAISSNLTVNPSVPAGQSYYTGVTFRAFVPQGNDKAILGVSGGYNYVINEGLGAITTLRGFEQLSYNYGYGGSVGTYQGLYVFATNWSDGSVANMYGAYVDAGTSSAVGTLWGMYLRARKSGGPSVATAYGLEIADVTAGTTSYAIYTGAGLVRFGGIVNTTESYQVDGVKVVGNRVIDARIDDAINSGDATTDGVIDAIRDALITHGLVAAA